MLYCETRYWFILYIYLLIYFKTHYFPSNDDFVISFINCDLNLVWLSLGDNVFESSHDNKLIFFMDSQINWKIKNSCGKPKKIAVECGIFGSRMKLQLPDWKSFDNKKNFIRI